MITPAEFALALQRASARTRGEELTHEVFKALDHTAAEARDTIGHEIPEWPALQPSTVAEKERLGFTGQVSGSDPLLRTGLYRSSISAQASRSGNTVTGIVGSDDGVVAAVHEFGTSRVPPRPVLAPALALSQHVVEEAIGQFLVRVLTGKE